MITIVLPVAAGYVRACDGPNARPRRHGTQVGGAMIGDFRKQNPPAAVFIVWNEVNVHVERGVGRRRRRPEGRRAAFDHAAAPTDALQSARIARIDADRPAVLGAAHVEQAVFIAILAEKGRRAGSRRGRVVECHRAALQPAGVVRRIIVVAIVEIAVLCAGDGDIAARAVAVDDPRRPIHILGICQRRHRVGRRNDGRTGGAVRKAADRQKILPCAVGGRARGDRRGRIGAAPVIADDRRA